MDCTPASAQTSVSTAQSMLTRFSVLVETADCHSDSRILLLSLWDGVGQSTIST